MTAQERSIPSDRPRHFLRLLALLCALGLVAAYGDAGAATLDLSVREAFARKGRAALWVYFTDKGSPSEVAQGLASAGSTVSDRSRERRARVHGGVFHAEASDVPVAAGYLRGVEAAGATLKRPSRWLNAVSVETDQAGAERIAALPYVRRVAPVLSVTAQLDRPSDYGLLTPPLTAIQAIAAHDSGYSAAGVVIAVFDTGFRKDHVSLSPLKRIAEWDFAQSDGETANQPGDHPNQWFHGTGCWSILASYMPGTLVGPAYNAQFALAKIIDINYQSYEQEDNWVAAAEWADSIGVDLVATSIVALYYTYDLDGESTAMAQATNILTRHGILVVSAMGNSGPDPTTMWTPSDCDSILAVGNVDASNVIAPFSSRGPTQDGRGKPDLVAQGQSMPWADAGCTTCISGYDGTSLAQPQVSGAAALVMEAHPEWTSQQVRYALKSTADKASQPDSTTYGWGRPNTVKAIYQSTLGPPIYPKPFGLVAPATQSQVSGPPVTFRWRKAKDLTPGDAVTYGIQIRKVSSGTVVFTATTPDTFRTYSGALEASTLYEWSVTATDLLNHVRTCMEPFRFTTTGGGSDQPPSVTAPPTVSGSEGTLVSFSVTASDPDGNAITSLTAAPLPTGAVFTPNGSNTSGTFQWTPGFTQSGSYTITFTASNALSGGGSTAITIANVDRAPSVTAPASASGSEGTLLTFSVTASDPDGDSITSLTGSSLPSGAVFTPGGGNTSGTFTWTPGFTQSGSYNVTFTASNALSGGASTSITIANVDRAPVVTAPATVSGSEGTLVSFSVTANDPDGNAISSLTAAPLPTGAVFNSNGPHTSGTFQWTPTFSQAGSYDVVFTASNALSGRDTTTISIANVDRSPSVTAPTTTSGSEGNLVTFSVTASDPDGDAIGSFTAAPLPSGAIFTPNGANTSGTFQWTPGFTQAGSYNVVFTASNALSGKDTTTISIANVDRAPTVTAPTTASGSEGTLLTFSVTASDPDGDAISSWSVASLPSGAAFTPAGGNASGTFNWTPSFAQAGSYNVVFTASNVLSGKDTTTISIANVDRGPTVTAPATALGSEGTLLTFSVTAIDPDGDGIGSLTAAPLPSGAVFTPSGGNTSGTFDWTPSFTQSGTYNITFTATNALSAGASTSVTIANADRAPSVTAPITASGAEGAPLTFSVTGSDPDGDAIGSLSAAPLPSGAVFTPNGGNTSGTFNWTPSFTQAGSYDVVFTASNALSGKDTTTISVANVDRAPSVTAPPTASGSEGALLTFSVTATDPDGDPIGSLTAAPLPSGAVFTPNGGNTSGTFQWTPGYSQEGNYIIGFTASNSFSANDSTVISVANVDQAPALTAPVSYVGTAGSSHSFTVTASDPDGDSITSWSFDASSLPPENEATFVVDPSNTFGTFTWHSSASDTGSHEVSFTASNALAGTRITSIVLEPRLMITVSDHVAATEGGEVVVTATATSPDPSKVLTISANGVPPSLTFSHVPSTSPASATVSGTLSAADAAASPHTITWIVSDGTGGSGNAVTVIHVSSVTAVEAEATGPPRVVRLQNRPNPFQSVTWIDLEVAGTAPSRPLTVRIYDVHGRLVRTLLDGARWASARLRWDGTTDAGEAAAAGVYTYRLEAGSVRVNRRLVLLR